MDSFWVDKNTFRIKHTLCKETVIKVWNESKNYLYTVLCLVFYSDVFS